MPEKGTNRPGRPRKRGPVSDSAEEKKDKGLVTSLSKALRILTLFTFEHPDWSPSEIATATGLNRGSVYRILRTMEHDFFLGLDPLTGRYHLGPAMYPAAYLTQLNTELVRMAHPYIERLAANTGETANIAVDIDGWVVIIDEVLTSHIYKPKLPIGMAIGDLHNSHAKLFLAYKSDAERHQRIASDEDLTARGAHALEDLIRELDTIRVEGVAYDLESMPGVCAFSVPVYDHVGTIRASLSIVAPSERFGAEQMTTFVDLAKDEASGLSSDLGHQSRKRGAEKQAAV